MATVGQKWAGNLPSNAARIPFTDVTGKGDNRPEPALPGRPAKGDYAAEEDIQLRM